MTYAGIQMLMEKLNLLINSNHIPFFNNPEITSERPQFQLLYDELGSMIQTLFMDEHHDLEKVKDLKKRFTDAAEEAQHIVDVFLSGVHFRNNGNYTTSEDFNPSLNLDDVRRSFKSVEVEFMTMRTDGMKMGGSSPRPEGTLQVSAAAAQSSISRNSPGSKKLLDEIVVGFDGDVGLIRDKLVEDKKKLDVVSIVGMGGIGKTTLATKVFNDAYVKHHFRIREWVTVSQTYDKRSVLIQILESFRSQIDLEKASEYLLCGLVHKHLFDQRYLIVIDDIWNKETWNNLKSLFPHDKETGSRILLTSRLTEVAKHANSVGLIHRLGYLTTERSWELLRQKVFHGNECCPEWSINPGMRIAENCKGLPLAVVVIAGVLAKEKWSEMFWMRIANGTGSYIVDDQSGCLETLGLSYNHLPFYLRECFCYLGGFPDDYEIKVTRLIWLWVAEGFIQNAGNRSLEDIAEGYLMDLIDRNLVTVVDRSRLNGRVIACTVHDLVRELCLQKAKEEGFILKMKIEILSSKFSVLTKPPYKPVRMFINEDVYNPNFVHPPYQRFRSILFFTSLSDDIANCFHSFVLLRVLDLQKCRLNDFPKGMELLVHLRYLVIWTSSENFPSSICNLWNLQTLIYIRKNGPIFLPSNISDLVNLRHLWSYLLSTKESLKMPFILPSIEKPMNLQTISNVKLGDGVDNFHKCFPCIKVLACNTYPEKENDFKSLTCLEKLNVSVLHRIMELSVHDSPNGCGKNHITFPATLKTLTLAWCGLPWSDMSIIQSLPNLEILKLRDKAFEGSRWKTDSMQFQKLKFLRLESLDIKLWEADSTSFPCLKQLEIFLCDHLEEIPIEIGDIPTLVLIKTMFCRHSVGESVRRIQQEQRDFGNYDLKINVLTSS